MFQKKTIIPLGIISRLVATDDCVFAKRPGNGNFALIAIILSMILVAELIGRFSQKILAIAALVMGDDFTSPHRIERAHDFRAIDKSINTVNRKKFNLPSKGI